MRRRRAARTGVALLALAGALGCASEPPPPEPERLHREPAPRATAEDEPPPAKAAKAAPRAEPPEAIAEKIGVAPGDLKWSQSRASYAAALAPKPDAGGAGVYRLAVFRAAGERAAELDAARPGAVSDLRFLGEDRLAYRVTPPQPPPPSAKKRAKRPKPHAARKKAAPPPLPTAVYVIQPLAPGAAPIICEGRRFTFARRGDHIAWVSGEPGHEWVGADGVQVYPRAGVTAIQGDPEWSPDGNSLAVIEGGPQPKLVVLVEIDNPSGDNTWPLPPEAADPTLRVIWAGTGRIVVGHTVMKPVFATSFTRDKPLEEAAAAAAQRSADAP